MVSRRYCRSIGFCAIIYSILPNWSGPTPGVGAGGALLLHCHCCCLAAVQVVHWHCCCFPIVAKPERGNAWALAAPRTTHNCWLLHCSTQPFFGDDCFLCGWCPPSNRNVCSSINCNCTLRQWGSYATKNCIFKCELLCHGLESKSNCTNPNW